MIEKTIHRVLSLTLAAALTLNILAVTAFAAAITPVDQGSNITIGKSTSGTDKMDIFYFDPNDGVQDKVITDFNSSRDWIVCDSYSGRHTTDQNGVFTVKNNMDETLFTVVGGGYDETPNRIITSAMPIIRFLSVDRTTAEKGQGISVTFDARPYDSSKSVTAYTLTPKAGGNSITPVVTDGIANFAVDTSLLNVGTHTYTASADGKTSEVTFTVEECKAAVSGVTVNAPSAENVFTATVNYSAKCSNYPEHNDKAVTWSVNDSNKATIDSNGKLTITSGQMATEQTVIVTATSQKDNKKLGTYEFKYTPDAIYDASITGGQITKDITANPIELAHNESKTLNFHYNPSVSATSCNLHGSDTTHGSTEGLVWSLSNAPSGVSINAATGVVTIAASAPSAENIVVKVQSKTLADLPNNTATFSVSRASEPCTPVVNSITLTPSAATINVATGATATQSYTAQLNISGGCSNPAHAAANHDVAVTWGATSAAGVVMNNGTVTVTENQLVAESTHIVVSALAGGKSANVNATVVRPTRCNYKLQVDAKSFLGAVTPLTATVTSGNSFNTSGSTRRLVVNTNTATIGFSLGSGHPVLTGSCEHTGKTTVCPYIDNHRPKWSLDKSYSGITIDPVTGVLSVTRQSLANVETVVGVQAAIGGKNSVPVTVTDIGYIVVRNNKYSSDNEDSEQSAQREREEQMDKLKYRIEDADSKDVISMNLGDNTKLRTDVLEELRGRDVTVKLTVENGFTWIINGKSLKRMPDYQLYVPLGVNRIRDYDISDLAKDKDIVSFELDHDGSFYGTYYLRRQLDSEYENKYVYLYKYTDNAKRLTYKGSYKVDSDGYVEMPFTSASTYVITSKALYGEAAGSSGSNANVSSSTATTPGYSQSVAPVPSSSSVAASSSSSSSESSSSSVSEISSSSSQPPAPSEISRPTDTAPDQKEEPVKKKSVPIIVPILIVVVVLTVIAVVLLAKGGLNIGG